MIGRGGRPAGPLGGGHQGKALLVSGGNGTSALDGEQQAPSSWSHCCPAKQHHRTPVSQVRMELGAWGGGTGQQDQYGGEWWLSK